VAIHGTGVLETLQGLLAGAYDRLEESYEISNKLSVDRDAFLKQVFQGWNPARARGGGRH